MFTFGSHAVPLMSNFIFVFSGGLRVEGLTCSLMFSWSSDCCYHVWSTPYSCSEQRRWKNALRMPLPAKEFSGIWPLISVETFWWKVTAVGASMAAGHSATEELTLLPVILQKQNKIQKNGVKPRRLWQRVHSSNKQAARVSSRSLRPLHLCRISNKYGICRFVQSAVWRYNWLPVVKLGHQTC